jgi:hypothetical protein
MVLITKFVHEVQQGAAYVISNSFEANTRS